MTECFLGGDTLAGVELKETLEEVDCLGRCFGNNTLKWDLGIPRKLLHINLRRNSRHALERPLIWCSNNPHDANQLIVVVFTAEEGDTGDHFGEDTAAGPDVDGGCVGTGAEKDVRCAVPECYNLIGEGVDGNTEGARKTKIAQLQLSLPIDQQILRFQIPMQHSILMTKRRPLQQLIHKALDHTLR